MGTVEVGLRDDKFKLRPKEQLYFACERYDLTFTKEEVKQVKTDYKKGIPLLDIAEKLKRDQVEIAILLIDLAEKGKITPRPSGIF